jgi:predicted XRE-type DNA-binding protein
MKTAGRGVMEIRIHAGGEYRVFYLAAVHGSRISSSRRSDIVKCFRSEFVKKRQTEDIFEQLGFDRNQAANLALRSEMMDTLIGEIEKKGLTQTQAAKALGVSQPRISDLMRGKMHLFSIDTLITLLSALGLRVEMKVRRAA